MIISASSTRLVYTNAGNTTQLISTNEDSAIKMVFTSKGKVIYEIDNSESGIDEIDIIDVINLRSVKISSQSRFKTAKSINLVYLKEYKIGFLIFKASLVFIQLK